MFRVKVSSDIITLILKKDVAGSSETLVVFLLLHTMLYPEDATMNNVNGFRSSLRTIV
jgi:hypothetical protein